MEHIKNIAGRIGNFIKESKLKYQRKILKWKITYSPDELKRFSALTIISLTALIILVLCVVEETKNIVLHGQSPLFFVNDQKELSSTECNFDYINRKWKKDDDPCVIDFIRRFYLFNNNPLLHHNQPVTISNIELSTTYEERKVSQVVTKFMQSRGKKQVQGFFVEICCGTSLFPAAREQLSNIRSPFSSTIHLEKFWDWSGILIHSNPNKIDLIRNDQKNNKKLVSALPVCLDLQAEQNSTHSAVAIPSGNFFINEKKRIANSSYKNQETVHLRSTTSPLMTEVGTMDFSNYETFYLNDIAAKPVESLNRERITDFTVEWQKCFPLNSILLASNQSKIDFLSLIDLDSTVDGVNQFDFLQNIPWYQIDIKMVALKVSGYPDVVKRAVIEFMESVGFFKYASRNLKAIGEVVFLVKKRPFEKITLAEKYREY